MSDKWLGDPTRVAHLQRNGEIGYVQIQDYGTGHYRVAAFTPGYATKYIHPDGLPKINADRHVWCSSIAEASDAFDAMLDNAHVIGWKDYTP
jgi:hypothetical protein